MDRELEPGPLAQRRLNKMSRYLASGHRWSGACLAYLNQVILRPPSELKLRNHPELDVLVGEYVE